MGLLDYADAARKKLAGLLGDMPLVQMAQGRAEMPTRAGLLGALKSMPVFSPDAGRSAYEAALNIGPMGLGKIVYHGSPHKFDKFDASKIGTGEGAQAYGHGVYLADSPGVAESYAGMRPMAGAFTKNGEPWVGNTYAEAMAEARLRAGNGYDATIRKAIKEADSAIASRNHEEAQRAQDIVAALRAMKSAGVEPNTGALYKADLPDEWIPKMLDWDKPVKTERLQGSSGGQVWRNLVNGLGGEKEATDYLRSLGIPGIRYLDGGSRGNGKGSYNYVVFPGLEDQVKILERNGVPLGLLGGN